LRMFIISECYTYKAKYSLIELKKKDLYLEN